MRIVVIGLLILAVVVAGGTAFLVRDFLASQPSQQEAEMAPETKVKILIAKLDMPGGVAVTVENVEWREWPESAVADTYIVETDDFNMQREFAETVVRQAMAKGEPLTVGKLFRNDAPGFMAGKLRPGMRAVAIPVDPNSAAAGFILPGDYVDLLLTHDVEETKDSQAYSPAAKLKQTTGILLEGILVIAIDQQVDEFKTQAQISRTMVVEVTPKQAEIITVAKSIGKIDLVLRSLDPGEGLASGSGKKLGDKEYRSFTTNVEVSPLFEFYDAYFTDVLGMPSLRAQAEGGVMPKGRKRKLPSLPRQSDKPAIKIYRGGAGSVEEVGGEEEKKGNGEGGN